MAVTYLPTGYVLVLHTYTHTYIHVSLLRTSRSQISSPSLAVGGLFRRGAGQENPLGKSV